MDEFPLRFLVVRRGCAFCHLAKKAILFVNRYLPYNKRIQIFDNYEYEELGFQAHPFIQKMLDDKVFDGYPFLYIDEGVIEPAPTECLIITIATKVSEDLLTSINFGGRIISPNVL